MLKDIILIGSGLLGGLLFVFVRNKIFKQTKEIAEEKFNLSKFASGMLNVTSSVKWAKDICSLINIRKIIIVGIIVGAIYGYGYYKGIQGKPVHFNLDYEKEFTLQLDGQRLYKPRNSNRLEVRDEKGNIIKVISAKDIPELQKKLKPYGIVLEPIFVIGGATGEKGSSIEAGGGLSIFKYFRWKVETFLTQKGCYIGTSYQITNNSGAGIGAGKGYKGDNRVILYYKWRF